MRGDPEMRDFAEEEIAARKALALELELQNRRRAIPNDERRCCWKSGPARAVTSRPCFGGDSAACIRAMPRGSAGRWRCCTANESELGVPSWEIICRIDGAGAYSRLKFVVHEAAGFEEDMMNI